MSALNAATKAVTIVVSLVLAVSGTVPPILAAPAAPRVTGQRFVIVPGESSVTYRVDETLFNEGNRVNTAVGTTTVVRGEVLVDRARPANSRIGTITVDISQFKSNSERRDNAIRQRWLESATYADAVFTATEITGLPDSSASGREIPVQITGNLTARDVTRPTTWAATIKLDGNTLTIIGRTTIRMTDFGFDPPVMIFLRTENDVRLEFHFVARS